MSSRDEILAQIRTNIPKVDRPLPHVPLFDDKPPASLMIAFKDNLQRMGGVATLTHRFARRVEGTGAKIYDTLGHRKREWRLDRG